MDLRVRLIRRLIVYFVLLLVLACGLVALALREDVAEEIEASSRLAELMLAVSELPDGSVVWVNRGFIPQALHLQWRQPAYLRAHSPAGQVSISGLVRKSEPKGGFLRRNQPALQQWHSRDVAAMAQALQLPHAAPFFVDAGLPSKQRLPDAQAAGEQPRQSLAQLQAQDWPRAGLTEVHFRNPHLVYALTWYALAAMVLGAAWIVRRYRRRQ